MRYQAAECRNCETLKRRTGANFCARCLRAAALNRSGCAAKSTDKLPLRSCEGGCPFVCRPGIFAHLFLAAPTSTINASRIPNLNRNLRPARSRRMLHRNYVRNIAYLNRIISYFLLYIFFYHAYFFITHLLLLCYINIAIYLSLFIFVLSDTCSIFCIITSSIFSTLKLFIQIF